MPKSHLVPCDTCGKRVRVRVEQASKARCNSCRSGKVAPVTAVCPCGTTFVVDHDRRIHCSRRCNGIYAAYHEPRVSRWRSMLPWSWCQWCDSPYVNRLRSLYCGDDCRANAERARARCRSKFLVAFERADRPVLLRSCSWCNHLFDAASSPLAKACIECRRRARAWRDEQRYKSNPITVQYLAERDGWVCRIPGCGKPITLRTHVPGNQWSPSRDHIVPVSEALAAGWSWDQIHHPSNQRLAHNGCNGRRGVGGYPEQLTLSLIHI